MAGNKGAQGGGKKTPVQKTAYGPVRPADKFRKGSAKKSK